MNRRDWLKSLVALAISSRIPVKEVSALASLSLAIPIGSIFQMWDANGGTVHILKTDHGFEKLEGGVLSKKHFPKLFEAIGETYGKGDTNATFRLPDLRAKVSR